MPSIQDVSRLYQQGIEDGVKDVARAILNEADMIIRDEAIDQGDLADSGEVKPGEQRFEKIVAWTAKHAAWVNFPTGPAAGRKRYLPPLDAILEWVKRNLRISTEPENEGDAIFKATSREGTRSASEAEALAVAQAVRWNIYQNGTQGVHYAERGVDKVRPRASRLMQEAIDNRLSGVQ